jgi:hypothetical protein
LMFSLCCSSCSLSLRAGSDHQPFAPRARTSRRPGCAVETATQTPESERERGCTRFVFYLTSELFS